jgi:hypothetical protein
MKRNKELLAALVAIILVTPPYIWFASRETIESSLAPLHWLGVIGMLMMLATETLYSLRKRQRGVRFGRLRDWLSVHIFMGIFGPYLVLLHTAWHFRGLAGVAMLFTILVVISGFIGRYIYTSIPRTASGVEMQASQIEAEIARLNQQTQAWLANKPARIQALAQTLTGQALSVAPAGSAAATLTPGQPGQISRGEWRRALAGLDRDEQRQLAELERLARQRRTLDRQMQSLAGARRLMATWHTVHVPLGMVLFTAATIHVLAAMYFVTLGR